MSSHVRMISPEGLTSFAHQGFTMKPERDGAFLVDPRHVAEYAAHGFVPAGQEPKSSDGLAAERVFAADPRPDAREAPVAPVAPVVVRDADPSKAAVFDRLAALPAASLERLAAMLEGDTLAMPDPRAVPPVAPLVVDSPTDQRTAEGRMSDDAIDAMTKQQLVAFCKARGIPMESPIDADVLRAKVRQAQNQE